MALDIAPKITKHLIIYDAVIINEKYTDCLLMFKFADEYIFRLKPNVLCELDNT